MTEETRWAGVYRIIESVYGDGRKMYTAQENTDKVYGVNSFRWDDLGEFDNIRAATKFLDRRFASYRVSWTTVQQ